MKSFPGWVLVAALLVGIPAFPTAAHDEHGTAAPKVAAAEAAPSGRVLGRVQPKPELVADVVAPIWGRIELAEKSIAVGEQVRRGQPLVRLILELSADERYAMEARRVEIQAAAATAQTQKQQSELEYRRAVALLKAAPEDLLRQQQVRAAERLYRAATDTQALLDRQAGAFETVIQRRDPRVTIVEAPISGTVTELNVRPGERNETGEFRKLCTIVDLSHVWIQADVFEQDAGAILNAASAGYRLSESDEVHQFLRKVAVSPWVDEKSRTMKVIFEADNPGQQLRLGMTVQVVFAPPKALPAPIGVVSK